eukprot:15465941-Alexandrium_andersonii.AAC.1
MSAPGVGSHGCWRGAVCWDGFLGVESCGGHSAVCGPCFAHEFSGASGLLSLLHSALAFHASALR